MLNCNKSSLPLIYRGRQYEKNEIDQASTNLLFKKANVSFDVNIDLQGTFTWKIIKSNFIEISKNYYK